MRAFLERMLTASNRSPQVVYALAAGTFLIGTTEFMIAGLVPEIATGLGVSIAQACTLLPLTALALMRRTRPSSAAFDGASVYCWSAALPQPEAPRS